MNEYRKLKIKHCGIPKGTVVKLKGPTDFEAYSSTGAHAQYARTKDGWNICYMPSEAHALFEPVYSRRLIQEYENE